MAAGQQRQREVAVAAAQLTRACDTSVRAPFKRPLSLTGGPQHFYLFIKIFKHPQFDIRFNDVLNAQNSPNFVYG
jgi:hypothetical protein